MAERRWALGPTGYSKLLSDLKQRIQARPIARIWIMYTETLSEAWPCPLDATQGASAPPFEQTRRSSKRVRRYVPAAPSLKTMRRAGAVYF
jgi:hypothetical protein